jgi:16S rRNA (cytosine967-C5)-methyltransferase
MDKNTGAKSIPVRLAAVKVLQQVVGEGQSLSTQLAYNLPRVAADERGLTQEICYGVLRWLPQLDAILEKLLGKPLKQKDIDVEMLLLVGIYQLQHLNLPDYAVISETVEVAHKLRKQWAKALVNGVLRRFQRESDKLLATLVDSDEVEYLHPQWLIGKLKKGWPQQWQQILEANNQRPPLTLRVNLAQTSRQAFCQQLDSAAIDYQITRFSHSGVTLAKPMSVEQIPGFTEGLASVQDGAAQLAAQLLAPQAGERVLDACAAPGGKTAHLLELAPECEMTALDHDPLRLERVEENLERLGMSAQVIAGDAARPAEWWDGQPFDRILLDAPCSATGVIRRHPDIKVLRHPDDIDALEALQRQILDALWGLLKPGGTLLYATCSVLPQENSRQIARFIERTGDVAAVPIDGEWGIESGAGRQILPGEDGMDGFFYALLRKVEDVGQSIDAAT